MAQGTFTTFEEFRKTIGDGSHNLGSDSFKVMLVTNATVPTAAHATPDSADFTEVSGTGYTAGGASAAASWNEVGGTSTFDLADVSWTQNGAGPANIYYAIIYNTTHVGTTDAIGWIDMTADGGTTPVSLQDGDINITFNGSGLFTVS